MTAKTAALYAERWPEIEWRKPIKVTRTTDGAWGYGCRICIGMFGMAGKDIHNLTQDPDVIVRHIAEMH